MKKQLLAIFTVLLVFIVSPAQAEGPDKVRGILKNKIDAVILLLRDKDMDKGVRNSNILELVKPIFDFEKMAQLTLGKKYWPGLSPEKQKEFSDLFIKRMQDSYLEKLDLYSNEDAIYEEPVSAKSKVHIPVNLVSKDNKISMLYKFYESGEKGWQIYDVELQGVSVIQTYRTQFDDVLKTGTIDDLLVKLERGEKFQTPEPK